MNDKIKTALKLIVSLGLGVLLIWFFYNQISSKKQASIDHKKYPDFTHIDKVLIKENAYCKVGDSLFSYNTNKIFYAETEASYNLNTNQTLNDKDNYVIGSYQIDIMKIMKKVFSNASWFWITLSLLASFSSHVIRSFRWRMMLQPLGYKPKAYNTFFAVMIMYMANMALPRLGEVLRCTFISRYENIPLEKSLGTMLTERLVDVICLFILLIVVLATQYKIINTYFQEQYFSNSNDSSFFTTQKIILIFLLAIVAIALAYFIYSKIIKGTSTFAVNFKKRIKGLLDGIISIKNIQNKPLFLLYSLAIWICYTLTIFFCLKAVPETSMQTIGAATTCLFFGSLAIAAVQGGLGIYPIVVSKILVLYGTEESIGYAYGWLSWVIQTLLVLVIGFISLILMTNINKTNNETN